MLNFSGIAPVLKRSGQSTTIHRRYARPIFLHQSFIEYANESIRHSLWARAFYQMHKASEKSRWVMIRPLAYKWIRILFRCWQKRSPTMKSATSNHCKEAAHLYSNTSLNPPPTPRE